LEVIEKRRERLEQLERDRQALMEAYTGIMPEALHSLTPEERHQLYRMLRMRVVAYPDKTLEVNGSFDSRELGTFTPTQ
ncbi:MAG: hypothetical protein M3N10_06920, partial [Actinomycetota bacterium]|nr:hypothetical protein [Actinomycetota bacterium]